MIPSILLQLLATVLVFSNYLVNVVSAQDIIADMVVSDTLTTAAVKSKNTTTIEDSAVDHSTPPSYLCLSAQDELCLGISTTADPAYNPLDLYHLQLKQRDNNEMKGLDFQKMRWRYSAVDGRIRLANYSTLCVAKMDRNDPNEVVLRPCGAQKALDMWNVGFTATGVNETGTITIQSIPDQCLTVMRCGTTTLGRCDPTMDEPYIGTVFDKEALRGTYVKLAQCQPGNPSQMFQQIINCAPGCSPTMQQNSRCDLACQNLACAWDNGYCPVITPAPTKTVAPSVSPTSYPSMTPTSSVPTTAPSTSVPTSAPVRTPTFGAPSHSPTPRPTTSTPTLAPSSKPSFSPTRKPTRNPTMQPTKVPTKNPTETPTMAPTSSQPTMTPSNQPTVPTQAPSVSPTEQNVTVLGASPMASSTTTASDLWWVWLIIALLSVCLCGTMSFMCIRYRNRRERELELQARRLQHEQAKLGGGSTMATDIEAIADSPKKLPQEGPGETTPPKQPSPTVNQPTPGSITQMKSNSPVIPPEFVEQRRHEDVREAKERRAARRSVMKLLSAMNELEDAFQTVDKELQTDVVADDVESGKDENLDDVENRIRLDGTPSRMRANTSSPRKRAPLQPLVVNTEEINRMTKKENHELMMEMRAQKINSAIQKVENAIGTLEQRIVHEKVKSMGKVIKQGSVRHPAQSHKHPNPERRSAPQYHADRLARMSGGSAMSSKSGVDSSYEDGLNTSSDSIAETRRLSTLIIGKNSRGGAMM